MKTDSQLKNINFIKTVIIEFNYLKGSATSLLRLSKSDPQNDEYHLLIILITINLF